MTSLPSGIDRASLSEEIRPQDDLHQHVHHRWLEQTVIPDDKARWGAFAELAEEAERAVREIIDEAQHAEASTEQGKVGALYASFMDEDAIQAAGLEPIRAALESVDAITSVEELLRTIANLEAPGGPSFVGQFVDNDPGDPERYLPFFSQGGIGLPDESYYREPEFEEIREAYRAYLRTMLAHLVSAGFVQDAEAEADAVFSLETAIAKHHWNKVDSRDATKTYNVVAIAERFPELTPWLENVDAPAKVYDEVVVRQPSFIEGLISLLDDEHLPAWRAWLRLGILRSFAAYLPQQISSDNFAFYGTKLSGVPKQRVRWKRAVSLVEGALGDAVGRIYVERHFPPKSKEAIDELIEQLLAAYRESIETLEWMTPATRERALDKLEKFTPKIGYPSKWRDYASLEIGEGLIANVRATNAFEHARELGKIGKPIDREEWFMSPQTVNAYYNPGFNEIVFPAAILQLPFFSPDRDAAANFGAIGAVIGHEIGHGFDDQGSKYDGDGRLEDWWTEADRNAFEERTGKLIEQFNALTLSIAPEQHVNGELTIGENIGDLGGLGIAWKAYLRSLGGEQPPAIDGFTGAQRFFIAWAQSWQLKIRKEEALRLVTTDPHSPDEHRTNQPAKNVDAFYEAFDVQPGDAMYLAPEDRVTIW